MPRILVVDDSAFIRRAVSEKLASSGHEVVAVASGEEAVERTLRETFDLVVSDVRMGAMTGVQLCRVLRSDPVTATIPIVLLTASDDPRSRFWSRHGGADAHLAKEGAFESLLPTVDKLLVARRSADTGAARRPTHVDAAARVSAVLDRQLFDAVVAAEARALMAHIDDREGFLRAAANLLHDVLAVPCATLSILGESVSHAIVLHQGAPVDDATLVASLGLEATSGTVVALRAGNLAEDELVFENGATETFALDARGERLGSVRLFAGSKRVGSDDRATVALLVDALAPVVKSLLLLEETRRLAHTDALTGIANRRTLVERLELEDRRSDRYGYPLTIALFDIDYFKSVNDGYGHAIGDAVLRAVAKTLASSVRNVDLVGRWGGEEFLAILAPCDTEQGFLVAERIRAAVAALPGFVDGPGNITISGGVATRATKLPSSMQLVELADVALYRAKNSGRNRIRVFDGA